MINLINFQRSYLFATYAIFILGGFSLEAKVSNLSAGSSNWSADNGNGTYSNPIFYDEFSDPDLIRVGDTYYMTGTTMHAMPGLPILRSKDLVNWEFVAYAMDRLDLAPRFRLEDGDVYGRGIWAPSLRYHDGTFYIFSNVNGFATQVFSAKNPAGPWTRHQMDVSLHDLSVLFDDDGKIYVVWGYRDLKIAQLTSDLTGIVPGTQRQLFTKQSQMGEGAHLYKINGKYFILSAWWDGRMRMPAARADNILGPWEVNPAVSIDEDFGLAEGYRLVNDRTDNDFAMKEPNLSPRGRMSLHQGGIVQTPKGEWWGFSMLDYNSVGRLVSLSPVTWQEGWPYFGLPGNLGRTPRTWVKPAMDRPEAVHVPYERNDTFDGHVLKPVWQWNHVPVDEAWSLKERPGHLRLHTLPAKSFWHARNSLTQRAIGPESTASLMLDASHLGAGDVAGLGLLSHPYGWIGVTPRRGGLEVLSFDERTGQRRVASIRGKRIWLRASCNFMTEKSQFSYSTDGRIYKPLGDPFIMFAQGRTFQGIRYSMFAYNETGMKGGYADFDRFDVDQPFPSALRRPIPYGQQARLSAAGSSTGLHVNQLLLDRGDPSLFDVIDMGLGRVALRSEAGFISVNALGLVALDPNASDTAKSFQWIETPTGELVLMSLSNHRFLTIDPATGAVSASSPGPQPGGMDGVRLDWSTELAGESRKGIGRSPK